MLILDPDACVGGGGIAAAGTFSSLLMLAGQGAREHGTRLRGLCWVGCGALRLGWKAGLRDRDGTEARSGRLAGLGLEIQRSRLQARIWPSQRRPSTIASIDRTKRQKSERSVVSTTGYCSSTVPSQRV